MGAKNINSPIFISHRGLSQNFDENTIKSFQEATQQGFKWIETDLRLTQDNHIVLHHDPSRVMSDKKNDEIMNVTRSSLEQIELEMGGKILFLDDFMNTFKNENWVFDIKVETGMKVVEQLIPVLKKDTSLIKKIIFLFWSEDHQNKLLKEFPTSTCFARESECKRSLYSSLLHVGFLSGIKKKKIYAIPPLFKGRRLLTQSRVDFFKKRNALTLCYLPETLEETKWGIESGVDYVLTNYSFKDKKHNII